MLVAQPCPGGRPALSLFKIIDPNSARVLNDWALQQVQFMDSLIRGRDFVCVDLEGFHPRSCGWWGVLLSTERGLL